MITNALLQTKHLLVLAVFVSLSSFAQTRIAGEVTNSLGSPVASASVLLKESNTGTLTDSIGKFSLSTKLKGTQTLQISYIGFKKHTEKLVLADSVVKVSVMMQETANTLDEVTVGAGSFEASDKAKGASLTPIDAYTVAGNGGDIANALRSLPGSQQIGEREGLFVRGGTNEETKQFIDGALLKNPNYTSVPGLMQPARLNLFLFKGVLFNTGGYSALYGQAMSSALILESIDLPDKSSANLSLFPPHGGVGFQNLSRSKTSSYGAGISYSNQHFYNSIVPQKPDYYYAPEYFNLNANYRLKVGQNGFFKAYFAINNSAIGMRNPDVDSLQLKYDFNLKSKNIYGSIGYRDNLNENWKIDAGLTYTFNRDDIKTRLLNHENAQLSLSSFPFDSKNTSNKTTSDFAQGRIVLTRNFERNQALRFGGEHFYFRDNWCYNESPSILTDHLSAAFAEGDIRISENIAAKLGVRMEYSSLFQKASIAPRASFAYRIRNDEQVNLAYGVFYQKPENLYLFQNRNLNLSNAKHYVLNYSKKVNNRFFRTEVYYKKYNNLITTYPDIKNSGTGYAKGIELFWRDKKTIKNLDYWVTYTYLDSKRNYLNFPESIRPAFTTPHTFTVAIKRFFENLNTSVNVSYSYASGRPYYDIREGKENQTAIYDSGTARSYNVLNLHVARMMRFFKKSKVKDYSGIAFGANNLLGTRQIFGYNYSYNGLHKTPVTLPATRMYFLGVFMSLGIDRTDDVLDQNL